jgi:hypothetical protein
MASNSQQQTCFQSNNDRLVTQQGEQRNSFVLIANTQQFIWPATANSSTKIHGSQQLGRTLVANVPSNGDGRLRARCRGAAAPARCRGAWDWRLRGAVEPGTGAGRLRARCLRGACAVAGLLGAWEEDAVGRAGS